MKEHGRTRLTSSIWAQAIEQEDKLAIELIDEAVVALGAGIASAVNLLDVEAVVIGGGLGVRFGQPIVERIATAMHPHLFNDAAPRRCTSPRSGDLGRRDRRRPAAAYRLASAPLTRSNERRLTPGGVVFAVAVARGVDCRRLWRDANA